MHTDKNKSAKDEGITRRENRFSMKICVDPCPSVVSVLPLKIDCGF